MKPMKNLTISLEVDVYQRLRIAAAEGDMSMSRYVSQLLERQIRSKMSAREAIEKWLSGPSLNLLDSDGKAPTTDELNS
jgi:predicted CopG family antitoxin